jgi:hypothetical protein
VIVHGGDLEAAFEQHEVAHDHGFPNIWIGQVPSCGCRE